MITSATFIVNSALEVFPQESCACHSNCVVPVKLSAGVKTKVPSGLNVSVPSSEPGGVIRECMSRWFLVLLSL